jgi:hypothetical protein
MQKTAIVIQTCDKYEFLWKGWRHYFVKHWDFNIPSEIWFCNEENGDNLSILTVKDNGLEDILIHCTTGTAPWGERLIRILDGLPPEIDTIFYMQEDFWLHRTLPKHVFESRLKTFRDMDMNAYRCCEPSKHFLLEDGQQAPYKFSFLSPYLMTHQASFWKKDFLRSCILPHEDPWQNEKRGTDRIAELADHGIYFAPFRFYHTVCQKGKLTELGEQLNAAI